jgi:hypothetical protein
MPRLSKGGRVDNFLTFRPRRNSVVMDVKIPQSEEVDAKLVEAGLETLEYSKRANAYPTRPGDKSDIEKHAALLKDLMHRAYEA